jgi:hypothetical protein
VWCPEKSRLNGFSLAFLFTIKVSFEDDGVDCYAVLQRNKLILQIYPPEKFQWCGTREDEIQREDEGHCGIIFIAGYFRALSLP